MEDNNFTKYGMTIIVSVVTILIAQFVANYSKREDSTNEALRKEVTILNERLTKLEKNLSYIVGRYTDADVPMVMDAPPNVENDIVIEK